MSELFEKVWKTYPKKPIRKAKEQFLKKIKSDEDFERFKTGYKAYLKYIKLNTGIIHKNCSAGYVMNVLTMNTTCLKRQRK